MSKKKNNPFDEYVVRPYETNILEVGNDPECTHRELLKNVPGGMVGTCLDCGRVKQYKAKVVGEVLRNNAVQKRRT